MAFRGMQARMASFQGHGGDRGEAYYACPEGAGPFPGIVIIHHMPGWDEWTTEVARKFAHHGYAAFAPDLYFRTGDGALPETVAKVRAAGGLPDAQMVADVAGAIAALRAQPHASGKVALIGFCAGGRQCFLAACSLTTIDAAIDCWGGRVVVDDPATLTPLQPVAPIDRAEQLSCPLLGLFGNDDENPSPAHVDRLETELKRLGKTYEFHRYDGAGHAFFAHYRPHYRQEQAQDGWLKIFAFLEKTIGPDSAV